MLLIMILSKYTDKIDTVYSFFDIFFQWYLCCNIEFLGICEFPYKLVLFLLQIKKNILEIIVFQNHFIYLRKKYALMPPMSII